MLANSLNFKRGLERESERELNIAEASDFWQANSIEFAFEIYGLEKCCQKLDRNGGWWSPLSGWQGGGPSRDNSF